jgi:hypothetical protein
MEALTEIPSPPPSGWESQVCALADEYVKRKSSRKSKNDGEEVSFVRTETNGIGGSFR